MQVLRVERKLSVEGWLDKLNGEVALVCGRPGRGYRRGWNDFSQIAKGSGATRRQGANLSLHARCKIDQPLAHEPERIALREIGETFVL
jgi:hypothetical protein